MRFLSEWMARRAGVVRRQSYTADVEWERSEELRVNRLGPGPEDIDPKEETQEFPVNDPYRPSRQIRPADD